MPANLRRRVPACLSAAALLLLLTPANASATGPDPIFVCHKPLTMDTTYCVEIYPDRILDLLRDS